LQSGHRIEALSLALRRIRVHVEAENLLLIAMRALRFRVIAGDTPFTTGFAAERVGGIRLSGGTGGFAAPQGGP
jgi:hypothetical protein